MNQLARLRRQHGVIIAVALLLVLIAVPVAVASSGGDDTPPAPPGSNIPVTPTTDVEDSDAAPDAANDKAPATHTDPDYWNEKRMGEATPAPMPTDS